MPKKAHGDSPIEDRLRNVSKQIYPILTKRAVTHKRNNHSGGFKGNVETYKPRLIKTLDGIWC